MFESIVVSLIMMVVSAMIQSVMTTAAPIKNAEPGTMDIPTAEEGGVIGVVFGTVVIKTANVCWYGDSATEPIQKTVDSGGKK